MRGIKSSYIDSDLDDKFNRRIILEKIGNSFPTWTAMQLKVEIPHDNKLITERVESVSVETYTNKVDLSSFERDGWSFLID